MNSSLRHSINALGDLAARVPQLHTIVNSVADQRRRRQTNRLAREAGWFGAGLALGAGLTTLWTPTTGAEVRKRVSDQVMRIRNSIASKRSGAPVAKAARKNNKKELS